MGIKFKVNENFFEIWSPEMAYVLGYLYADGSLENAEYIRGKYMRVSSVERKNISIIRSLLKSQHRIIEEIPELETRRKKYLLRIGSHKMYDDLVLRGLYPNKSLTIKFPQIPPKFLSHFVLGYFDGDGSVRVYMEKGKTKEKIIKKLNVIFTCGSLAFLKSLAVQLKNEINTHQIRVYDSCRSFMLSYSTEDSIRIFKFFYGEIKKPIYSRRKFDIFHKYFILRPQRIDSEIKKILKNGRVAK